ncbi:MAG: HNH endonuclease [Elusimicrobia bacterium]|nr:HNH endonuclease [Elusimicrobiota bacterium]
MSHVLVLNRSLLAVQVASLERALTLLYLDRAAVVDEEYRTYNFQDWAELSKALADHPEGFIHTPTLRLAVPEVIALRFFDKVPLQAVPFTRRNIYHHYGYRCCYCGRRLPTSELNLDHVLPRSRGGGADWSNIVTACIPCNLRKASRTPIEAGMAMVIPVSKPKLRRGVAVLARSPIRMRRSWQRFVDNIYWDSQIEE